MGRLLRRAGLNRLAELEPAPPVQRYDYARPGGAAAPGHQAAGPLLAPGPSRHRQPARGQRRRRLGVGGHRHRRSFAHRAYATIELDERGPGACRALLTALRYYCSLGIRFTAVVTDNGSCYKSRMFARLLRRMDLRHIRTRPYTPRTNVKAERFIQTALREWAYARAYEHSDHRAQALPDWLHHYNWHRTHASLANLPPASVSTSR